MNAHPTTLTAAEANPAAARVLPALGAICGLTALGDFLFWRALPGVSLGIFSLALGALLLWLGGGGRPRASVWWLTLLLAVSAAQSAIELSFSNVLITAVLLVAMLAETAFASLPGVAGRLVEGALTLLKAPLRWFAFWAALFDGPLVRSTAGVVTGENLARACRVLLPGLALSAIFAVVLSSGNVVLGHYFAQISDRFAAWLWHFDFSPARFALWMVFATIALAFFWPGRGPQTARGWTQAVPRWRRRSRREAVWQTVFALVALNGLFFTANTIDAVFLWRHVALPDNVNASKYVHAGVWSLTFAVVLSAVVLAGMFQQEAEIAGARPLKALGHVWVIQNLVLIAGVFLRLKLYVDAYQLTEKRVYVGCFLGLVTMGFFLLAWAIERSKGLRWLIGANCIASFAMLFIVQFPDVAGAVARENVARWQREPGRTLDIDYLVELGPGAWPSLVAVARDVRQPVTAADARVKLRQLADLETTRRADADWRSWQARHETGASAVLTYARGDGEPPGR